eukprot:TRINITY_DN10694_c0_g1_i1.p1 TRINITY_DN10694_c0_g1~~TRINITY_DN10694_c0_g1_i1.p1  ORF type:complete len:311 (+),score=32.31 TRINITY_DN10694_c0_g1_i1:44-934(+)
MESSYEGYETLAVRVAVPYVLHVELNRPNRANAMNAQYWHEMRRLFAAIAVDPEVRAVVISGAGKHFSAGIDMQPGEQPTGNLLTGPGKDSDVARHALKLQQLILSMQESFTCITRCPQPVIAAIHGACMGGAVDLITACDMRFCSDCASFSVKEVAVGLCADVGTLQRLPRVVGNQSWVRDICYSARTFGAAEAERFGLVSKVCSGGRERVLAAAMEAATVIAAHSPLAVAGTKRSLEWSQDHSITDGLAHVALWNSAALMTKDLMIGGRPPERHTGGAAAEGTTKPKRKLYSNL